MEVACLRRTGEHVPPRASVADHEALDVDTMRLGLRCVVEDAVRKHRDVQTCATTDKIRAHARQVLGCGQRCEYRRMIRP